MNRGNIGSPHIGNNVYIGINATVVGNVHIGSDVLIAPNSYVNFDVPDHSVVIGNPAVVHHKENAIEVRLLQSLGTTCILSNSFYKKIREAEWHRRKVSL